MVQMNAEVPVSLMHAVTCDRFTPLSAWPGVRTTARAAGHFRHRRRRPAAWPTNALDFLHRTAEGAKIYFVANRTAREETVRCTFHLPPAI